MQLNEGMLNPRGTKPAWYAIGKLKAGMSKTKPSTVKSMKKPDGSTCKTPEENAEVFRSHFTDLFGRQPQYDATVLNLIDQRDTVEGLDHMPSDEEIKEVVNNLRNSAPGESDQLLQLTNAYYSHLKHLTSLNRSSISFGRQE